MDIKKSELLSYLNNINQKNLGKDLKKNAGLADTLKNDMMRGAGNISLDRLRSKVLGIQADLKEMQSQITYNQAQIAFLNEAGDSNWQEELRRSMQENFRSGGSEFRGQLEKHMVAAEGKNQLLNLLDQQNRDIATDARKKQVELENILSSGLVEGAEELSSKEIVKDILQSNDLFSKLRAENIRNLLNS